MRGSRKTSARAAGTEPGPPGNGRFFTMEGRVPCIVGTSSLSVTASRAGPGHKTPVPPVVTPEVPAGTTCESQSRVGRLIGTVRSRGGCAVKGNR